MCVRSGVAPTCQSSASIKVDAATGAGPPAAVARGATTPTSSTDGCAVGGDGPHEVTRRLRAGQDCAGSATPKLSWTRSNNSANSRLPMPRSSNGLSSVTVSREAWGWTSVVSPRTSSRTRAARSSLDRNSMTYLPVPPRTISACRCSDNLPLSGKCAKTPWPWGVGHS